MNIDEVGGGALMKASDLETTPFGRLVHVSAVTVQNIRNGRETETKAVVHFVEEDKGLALNATNKSVLRNHYGRETDGWVGQPVVLFLVDDKYMDRPCKAIRVRLPKPGYAARMASERPVAVAAPVAPAPAPQLVPVNGQPGRYVIDDEPDIPF